MAIGYAHGEDGMHSRVFDLTPWHDDSWTRYKTGNAEVYFEFLSQLVIPMVEKKLSREHFEPDTCWSFIGRLVRGMGIVEAP